MGSALLKSISGLEYNTRPLVFTSASGCRASENFDISSENYFFPINAYIFVMQGEWLVSDISSPAFFWLPEKFNQQNKWSLWGFLFNKYSDILLKKHKLHLYPFVLLQHTCCCVGMVSVTSEPRYVTSASHYQSRSSMYIRGLIPRKWPRQFRSDF